MDKLFISKYMPKLESHLNYRLIDVSTFKELFKYGFNLILKLSIHIYVLFDIFFTNIFFCKRKSKNFKKHIKYQVIEYFIY